MTDPNILAKNETQFRDISNNAERSSKAYAILSEATYQREQKIKELRDKDKLFKDYRETKLKLARLERELAHLNNKTSIEEPSKTESTVEHYGVKLIDGKWVDVKLN